MISVMRVLSVVAVVMVLVSGSGCCGACPRGKVQVPPAEPKMQTKCPVMGGEINKSLFTDVKGCRVYVCCAGCIPVIEKEPDKFLEKIKANGEVPERVNPGPAQ